MPCAAPKAPESMDMKSTASLPDSIIIEGHALVSADGMIADHAGTMPPSLRNEADWTQFQAALDRSALVVLGRLGHASHPNPGRRRLVLTRSIERLEADVSDPLAMFWNPAGLDFGSVLLELGIQEGIVAVTGGTGTFETFLGLYDRFVLAESHQLLLKGGVPCFSRTHPRVALAASGLLPQHFSMIDVVANVSLTQWQRG